MKANFHRVTKHEKDLETAARQTVKQMLLAVRAEGFGQARLERVLMTWAEIASRCADDPDQMLVVDQELREAGVWLRLEEMEFAPKSP